MEFTYALQQNLFAQYPDAYKDLLNKVFLPSGCLDKPEDLPLEVLLYNLNCGLAADIDDEALTTHAECAVHVKVSKSDAAKAQAFPHLQRLTYDDESTTVFPKELATLPKLRVLQFYDTRKFHKLPKTLKLAKQLEGLILTLVQNITDISDIEALSSLSYVCLNNTVKIADYDPLQALPSLRHLRIESVDMSKIATSLAALQELDALELPSCAYWEPDIPKVAELLAALPKLKKLGLQSCELYGHALPPMPQLEALDINGGEDLHPDFIGAVPGLKALTWKHCPTKEMPRHFGDLSALELLDLSFSKGFKDDTDFSAFEGLTSLTHLDFSQNRLTRLPPSFSALRKLEQLDLGGFRGHDLAALHGLPNMRVMNLSDIQEQGCVTKLIMSLPTLECVSLCDRFDVNRLAAHPNLRLIVSSKQDEGQIKENFNVQHSAIYPK